MNGGEKTKRTQKEKQEVRNKEGTTKNEAQVKT